MKYTICPITTLIEHNCKFNVEKNLKKNFVLSPDEVTSGDDWTEVSVSLNKHRLVGAKLNYIITTNSISVELSKTNGKMNTNLGIPSRAKQITTSVVAFEKVRRTFILSNVLNTKNKYKTLDHFYHALPHSLNSK